jgi:hypothetical protein
VVLLVIFWQNSFPLPNSSRMTLTMSSAWVSCLANTSVLGTSVRPGKISLNRRSRNVRTTRRIWSSATTSRSSWLAV